MSTNDNDTNQTTPSDVAQWMLSTIEERGELSQNNAFYEINKQFGRSFTSTSATGIPSVSKSVLTAFRKISDDVVIWERGEKKWRKREFYDAPGRRQY